MPGYHSGQRIRLPRFKAWVRIPDNSWTFVFICGDGRPLPAPLQMDIKFGDPLRHGK